MRAEHHGCIAGKGLCCLGNRVDEGRHIPDPATVDGELGIGSNLQRAVDETVWQGLRLVVLIGLNPGQRTEQAAVWPLALGGGAGGAWGARAASSAVLGFLDGPLGRLLPLLPPVAPWVRTVQGGASAVRAVSGPLGLALAILSANQALGTRYERLLPLLLGVGALGGCPVEMGVEVIDAD